MRNSFFTGCAVAVLSTIFTLLPSLQGQSQQPDTTHAPAAPPEIQGGSESSQHGTQGRARGVVGKITALQSDSLEVARPDGTKISVKLTSATEFRKEREPAKISDFKVGDMVMIRTDQALTESSGEARALVVSSAPRGFVGRAAGGGPGGMFGTMGKDFVAGEVRSVDPPRLIVMRMDKVEQTLELNEESSLRRWRDSITMADIHPGDHIFARGAVANDVFVPKNLNVIPPEQWKRMQEMTSEDGVKTAPQGGAAPSTSPNPPEHPN